MNYTEIADAISTMVAIPTSNADFTTIFPTAITYAEDRICRELDMLSANVRDGSASATANNRNFNLPTSVGTFLIVDGLNVITPASTAPDSGTRNPLIPISRDVMDLIWPSTSGSGRPQYFAYVSQDTYSSPAQSQIILGPVPDAAYRIEVIGKIQPSGLTALNPNTYLSDNLPELLLAAIMVWMSGYLKNFGAQADDPKQATSWEGQYNLLKASADVYEARKRFGGASWTAKQIEPIAQPQRG